jgi:hypothetical protein
MFMSDVDAAGADDSAFILPAGFQPELPTNSRATRRRPNSQAVPPELSSWVPGRPLIENIQAALQFGRNWVRFVADASGYDAKRVIAEMFGEEMSENRVQHWNVYQQMVLTDQAEQNRLRKMGKTFDRKY